MDRLVRFLAHSPVAGSATLLAVGLLLYLAFINNRMRGVPDNMRRLKQRRWTVELLQETYARLEKNPMNVQTTKDNLPPRLDRRYIVTGGCGMCCLLRLAPVY